MTGETVFHIGAELLILAIITGIAFLIKKPKYSPEKEVYRVSIQAHKFNNAYLTEKMTGRSIAQSDTPDTRTMTMLSESNNTETELMPDENIPR